MWTYPTYYDVLVIGGGHAGCEAAYAAAKMGAKTLLLTMSPDTLAKMSCNPSIGGIAKGHIVREIDALGGIMGKLADRTAIHLRMLNRSKGAAVRSPRAQTDKMAYHLEMKHLLENCQNLEIKLGEGKALIVENGMVKGVITPENILFNAKTVVIASGTFLKGAIFIGHQMLDGGRQAEKSSNELSSSLIECGFKLGRLKTGTPPRIHKRSIDFSKTEAQDSEKGVYFSYDEPGPSLEKTACHITYTTPKTREIIHRDIKKCALFSGLIQGRGPRYCPSIEDKIIRFPLKERHQIFLEPEGLYTEEYYLNGLSTSMPVETQHEIVRSILGLEQAEIIRPAYAIEYDYVLSSQIEHSLETKIVKNLFLAGQINGTTGYEEAAAQGLIAGINAAKRVQNSPAFIPKRSESYIGVLLDDLATKELDEPYRMFTSRAEHRLILRQDNADLRLRHYGHELGLIDDEQHKKLLKKKEIISYEKERLANCVKCVEGRSVHLSQILCRPEVNFDTLRELFPDLISDYSEDIKYAIEYELKYAGYITRQEKEIHKMEKLERIKIPANFPFSSLKSMKNEAKERLQKFNPPDLGAASRIYGVSPADISILMVELR